MTNNYYKGLAVENCQTYLQYYKLITTSFHCAALPLKNKVLCFSAFEVLSLQIMNFKIKSIWW